MVSGSSSGGQGGPLADIDPSALIRDVAHLVGRTRAFLLELDGYRTDIVRMHDERAGRLVEALEMTTAQPARPGTLRHVERAATELLRALSEAAPK